MSQLVLVATSTSETNVVARKTIVNISPARGKSAYEIWLEAGNEGTRENFLASLVGPGRPANVFPQAAYMHVDDLAAIRSGDVLSQDATRVTNGIRQMHEDALNYMLAFNKASVQVIYEGGASVINRRLMSDAFNNLLWTNRSRRDSRMTFSSTGAVIWDTTGWLDGQSVIRTDGFYSELLPSFAVPQCVWEWRQGAGFARLADFAANVSIIGQDNHLVDPVGFRTYRVNGAKFSGQMNTFGLRNITGFHEAMYNSTFDYITSRQGCGWQPMEHGLPGMIDRTLRYTVTGSTVTIVNPETGESMPMFTADHVGRKFALARQGVAQRSPDPEEEDDIRGPKWFTITGVSGNTATVSPTPDYPTGIDGQAVVGTSTFSFAAVRASTVAGSAIVTLSAPVAESLAGKVVSVVGAGYHLPDALPWKVNALGEDLTAVVISHSGNTLLLSVPAANTTDLAPFICSPQFYFGPEGTSEAALLHSLNHPTDDVHIRRMWCEAAAHGVVQAHFQSMTGSSVSDDSKLHGCSPFTHNSWGGNFACICFSRVSMRVDALMTHGMYSPFFGKFVVAGKKIELDLSGELVAWTTPTESSRYYLVPMNAEKVAFFVQENLVDNTIYFPQTSANQVMVRGAGDYDPSKLYVRSIGSARTPMGDEHPAWPPSEFGPTVATAFGTTRAGAVDAIAKGLFTPLQGYTYNIGGVAYRGSIGATTIPDLPGLVPVGLAADTSAWTLTPPTTTNLIAAANLQKVKLTKLINLTGSLYAQETDDLSAILNARLPALADEGIMIENDRAMDFSLKSRLQMCSNMRIDWGPATLWLDVSSHHLITHDTSYDAGQTIDNVLWRGARIKARSTAIRGHVFQFDARNSIFEDFSVEGYSGGMAFVYAGTDLILRDISVQSALVDAGGDDAFHLESGSRILAANLRAHTNDDCFIAVPATHFTSGHPRYARPLTDVQYDGCIGISRRARLCVVAVDGATDATEVYSPVKRVVFSDIKGKAPEGMAVVGKSAMLANQIDDILFAHVHVVSETDDATVTDAWAGRVQCQSSRPGVVGDIRFDHCVIEAPVRQTALIVDAPGSRVTLRDCDLKADFKAIDHVQASDLRISGGHYGVVSGGMTEFTVMQVSNAGARVEISDFPIFDGIPTNGSAIYCSAGTVNIQSMEANKAPGATGTKVIDLLSGTFGTVNEEKIIGTVDNKRNTSASGLLRVNAPSAPVRTAGKVTTIASDLATLDFSDLVVLDTEGLAASDNLIGLSVPSWLELGDVVPVAINNSARVITVKHNQTVPGGYGKIMTLTGADVVLSSTATRLKLMWLGDQFVDVTWAAGNQPAYLMSLSGTGDKSAEIIAALAAYDDVILPAGTWACNATIVMASGKRLRGSQQGTTLTTTAAQIITMTSVSKASVENLTIVGPHSGTSYQVIMTDSPDCTFVGKISNGNSGVHVLRSDRALVRLDAEEMRGAGIRVSGSREADVKLVRGRNIAGFGVYVTNDGSTYSGAVKVSANKFGNPSSLTATLLASGDYDALTGRIGLEAVGITVGNDGNIVQDVIAKNTGDNGISITSNGNTGGNFLIEDCDHDGLHIYGSYNSFSSVTSRGNRFSGLGISQSSTAGTASCNAVVGLVSDDNEEYGVELGDIADKNFVIAAIGTNTLGPSSDTSSGTNNLGLAGGVAVQTASAQASFVGVTDLTPSYGVRTAYFRHADYYCDFWLSLRITPTYTTPGSPGEFRISVPDLPAGVSTPALTVSDVDGLTWPSGATQLAARFESGSVIRIRAQGPTLDAESLTTANFPNGNQVTLTITGRYHTVDAGGSAGTGGGGGGSSAWADITGKPTGIAGYATDLPGFTAETALAADVTLTSADSGKTFTLTANRTITLPTAPEIGFSVSISCNSSSTATLVPGAASVDRDLLVYPGEWALLYWSGATWRRVFRRGFGINNAGAMGLLPDLLSVSAPGGLWVATSATANRSQLPSHMATTDVIVRRERRDANQLVMTVWSLVPSQGTWRATYAGGVWTEWSNGGSIAALTTAQLPTNVQTGTQVFDTDRGRMVVWNEALGAWVDSFANAVASGTAGLKLTVGSTAPVAPAVNDIWIDPASSAISFADLVEKPMTVAGYGIMDVTGMLPIVPATSGTWAHLGEGRGALGARSEIAGHMKMRPYVARATGSISSVAVGVNTAVASSLAKVAFYESVDGKPTTLIAESSDIDCSVTGMRTAAISAVPQVAGRQYWVGVRVNSNQSLNTDVGSPRIDGLSAPSNGVPTVVQRVIAYATAAPGTWGYTPSEATNNRDPWFAMGQYA